MLEQSFCLLKIKFTMLSFFLTSGFLGLGHLEISQYWFQSESVKEDQQLLVFLGSQSNICSQITTGL